MIIKQKTQPARKSTATMAVGSAVPESLHREVRSTQPKCVKYGTIWFLQTDHKKGRWASGTNARSNLQTLCGPCNRAKYRQEMKGASNPVQI